MDGDRPSARRPSGPGRGKGIPTPWSRRSRRLAQQQPLPQMNLEDRLDQAAEAAEPPTGNGDGPVAGQRSGRVVGANRAEPQQQETAAASLVANDANDDQKVGEINADDDKTVAVNDKKAQRDPKSGVETLDAEDKIDATNGATTPSDTAPAKKRRFDAAEAAAAAAAAAAASTDDGAFLDPAQPHGTKYKIGEKHVTANQAGLTAGLDSKAAPSGKASGKKDTRSTASTAAAPFAKAAPANHKAPSNSEERTTGTKTLHKSSTETTTTLGVVDRNASGFLRTGTAAPSTHGKTSSGKETLETAATEAPADREPAIVTEKSGAAAKTPGASVGAAKTIATAAPVDRNAASTVDNSTAATKARDTSAHPTLAAPLLRVDAAAVSTDGNAFLDPVEVTAKVSRAGATLGSDFNAATAGHDASSKSEDLATGAKRTADKSSTGAKPPLIKPFGTIGESTPANCNVTGLVDKSTAGTKSLGKSSTGAPIDKTTPASNDVLGKNSTNRSSLALKKSSVNTADFNATAVEQVNATPHVKLGPSEATPSHGKTFEGETPRPASPRNVVTATGQVVSTQSSTTDESDRTTEVRKMKETSQTSRSTTTTIADSTAASTKPPATTIPKIGGSTRVGTAAVTHGHRAESHRKSQANVETVETEEAGGPKEPSTSEVPNLVTEPTGTVKADNEVANGTKHGNPGQDVRKDADENAILNPAFISEGSRIIRRVGRQEGSHAVLSVVIFSVAIVLATFHPAPRLALRVALEDSRVLIASTVAAAAALWIFFPQTLFLLYQGVSSVCRLLWLGILVASDTMWNFATNLWTWDRGQHRQWARVVIATALTMLMIAMIIVVLAVILLLFFWGAFAILIVFSRE